MSESEEKSSIWSALMPRECRGAEGEKSAAKVACAIAKQREQRRFGKEKGR